MNYAFATGFNAAVLLFILATMPIAGQKLQLPTNKEMIFLTVLSVFITVVFGFISYCKDEWKR